MKNSNYLQAGRDRSSTEYNDIDTRGDALNFFIFQVLCPVGFHAGRRCGAGNNVEELGSTRFVHQVGGVILHNPAIGDQTAERAVTPVYVEFVLKRNPG